MTEAEDPAAWVRMMIERHGVTIELEKLTADAESMTAEERAEFGVIFEHLAFIEAGGPLRT